MLEPHPANSVLHCSSLPFPQTETAMFSFADTSKLMTTMATSTVTLVNVIVQWPFVVAYRASLPRR